MVADGGRGWTSFVLLIFELNLIVWAGYIGDRNAGNAIKELEVGPPDDPSRNQFNRRRRKRFFFNVQQNLSHPMLNDVGKQEGVVMNQ